MTMLDFTHKGKIIILVHVYFIYIQVFMLADWILMFIAIPSKRGKQISFFIVRLINYFEKTVISC